MTPDVQTLAVVRGLVGYLRDHPKAADTAEGIATWWLADLCDRRDRCSNSAFSTQVTDLSAALNWMQEHHLIEKIRAVDGHVRFRRNAEATDIEAALRLALEHDA